MHVKLSLAQVMLSHAHVIVITCAHDRYYVLSCAHVALSHEHEIVNTYEREKLFFHYVPLGAP